LKKYFRSSISRMLSCILNICIRIGFHTFLWFTVASICKHAQFFCPSLTAKVRNIWNSNYLNVQMYLKFLKSIGPCDLSSWLDSVFIRSPHKLSIYIHLKLKKCHRDMQQQEYTGFLNLQFNNHKLTNVWYERFQMHTITRTTIGNKSQILCKFNLILMLFLFKLCILYDVYTHSLL